jgi:hypothetical protein
MILVHLFVALVFSCKIKYIYILDTCILIKSLELWYCCNMVSRGFWLLMDVLSLISVILIYFLKKQWKHFINTK